MTGHDLSLGEFRALVVKALRGAGYPWGVAEDGADTCHRLAASAVDPSASLLRLLETVDGDVPKYWPDQHFSTRSGYLCPIAVGCWLRDGGDVAPVESSESQVLEPLLLRSMGRAGVSPTVSRIAVADNVLVGLERFAARTYAPATEASRTSGAGAAFDED